MAFLRLDVGRIDGPKMTAQGYLKADAFATRIGVFNYLRSDGTVKRELRLPEEVFNEDSLKSLSEITVTNDHPPESLTAENTKNYQVGFTGETVQKSDNLVKVKMTVTDAEVIKKIMNGDKSQLSCGYFCDEDKTPGVWNGLHYDSIQRNIRYNHLAIVERGRAGPEAKIRMDSNSAMMIDEEKKCGAENENQVNSDLHSKKERTMPAKIKIDSVEYEVSEGLAPVIVSKLDAMKKQDEDLVAAKKDNEALKGKNDALTSENEKKDARIKELEASKITDKEILEKADSLNKIFTFAKKSLGENAGVEKMDVATAKKEVVKKSLPSIKIDEKTADYIDAAFDTLYQKDADTAGDPLKQALQTQSVTDSAAVDANSSREKLKQDSQKLYLNNK